MTTLTIKKDKQEAFQRLPQKVKDAILSHDTGDKIRQIARTYNLRIDQIAVLEDNTLNVMLGLERPENLIQNLKSNVSLSDVALKGLVADLEEKIFKEIRGELMNTTQPGYVPSQPKEGDKEFDAYVARRMEQMKALGDEEGIKNLNNFLHGSIIDQYMPEIKAEVKAEMARRKQATSGVPGQVAKTVDLRRERRLPPVSSEDGPRESTPRVQIAEEDLDRAFVRPEPAVPVKSRPSDGESEEPVTTQDHPEEFITFPYKADENPAHNNVDVDLDELEASTKPVGIIKNMRSPVAPPAPAETPSTLSAEEKLAELAQADVAIPQKPVVPNNSVQTESGTETVAQPIDTAPKPIDVAPQSILDTNRAGSVSRSSIVEVNDDISSAPAAKSDPYREPVE